MLEPNLPDEVAMLQHRLIYAATLAGALVAAVVQPADADPGQASVAMADAIAEQASRAFIDDAVDAPTGVEAAGAPERR